MIYPLAKYRVLGEGPQPNVSSRMEFQPLGTISGRPWEEFTVVYKANKELDPLISRFSLALLPLHDVL